LLVAFEEYGTGKEIWVNASQFSESSKILAPSKLAGYQIDDMVECEDISAPFILWNLRQRFEHDIIYTAIADILISINPFKSISALYGPSTTL
jgi:myosin heavy subunit